MGSSNLKGDEGEFYFMAEAVRKGYWVAKTTQDCPYDIVLDRHKGKLERVQCKYRALGENDSVEIKMCDPWANVSRRVYNENEFDLIALYIPDLRQIALMPKELFTTNTAIVRINESKQKRKNAATLFSDYVEW